MKIPQSKRCPKCGEVKEQGLFNLSTTRPDGLQTYCIECQRPMKKNAHLKLTYGITQEQYDKRLKDQNGVCAICGKPETAKNNNGAIAALSVDHDHKTGKIRSLLCVKCNRLLGEADDDTRILEKALQYLKKHQLKRTSNGTEKS